MIATVLIWGAAIWGGVSVLLFIIFSIMHDSYQSKRTQYYGRTAAAQQEIDAYWKNHTLRRWALSTIWPIWFSTVIIPYTLKAYKAELAKAKDSE